MMMIITMRSARNDDVTPPTTTPFAAIEAAYDDVDMRAARRAITILLRWRRARRHAMPGSYDNDELSPLPRRCRHFSL